MLPISPKLFVAAVFLIAYVLLILLYHRKLIVVWAAVAVLLALRYLSPLQAWKSIEWNVVLLYFGMLFVSESFLYSRMPDFLATVVAGRAGRVSLALLLLCVFAGLLSTVLENVAVVLLVAPVGLAIARKCEVHPGPLLIGLAVDLQPAGRGHPDRRPAEHAAGLVRGLELQRLLHPAGPALHLLRHPGGGRGRPGRAVPVLRRVQSPDAAAGKGRLPVPRADPPGPGPGGLPGGQFLPGARLRVCHRPAVRVLRCLELPLVPLAQQGPGDQGLPASPGPGRPASS